MLDAAHFIAAREYIRRSGAPGKQQKRAHLPRLSVRPGSWSRSTDNETSAPDGRCGHSAIYSIAHGCLAGFA